MVNFISRGLNPEPRIGQKVLAFEMESSLPPAQNHAAFTPRSHRAVLLTEKPRKVKLGLEGVQTPRAERSYR